MKFWIFLLAVFFYPFALNGQINLYLLLSISKDKQVTINNLQNAVPFFEGVVLFDSDDSIFSSELYEFSKNHFSISILLNENLEELQNLKTVQEKLRPYVELSDSYFVLVERNEKLAIDSGFSKDQFFRDGYSIILQQPVYRWSSWKTRVLKSNLDWQRSNLDFDSWQATNGFVEKNHSIRMEGDFEAPSRERLLRRLEILTNLFKKNSTDQTLVFYLAQVLVALERFDEAIEMYLQRLSFGGDFDEVWFSKYMLAECYEKTGLWEKALYWYLEAFQTKPHRIDALQRVAEHYRWLGQNDLGCLFAHYGTVLSQPEESSINPYPALTKYGLDYEISICGYYTWLRPQGYDALDRIILNKSVPWSYKSSSYLNSRFYIKPLQVENIKKIEFESPLLSQDSQERYRLLNPCIKRSASGFKGICRTVNYEQKGAVNFRPLDGSNYFITRNFWLELDFDGKVLSSKEIRENLNRQKYPLYNLVGIEDCRYFDWKNQIYFVCTTIDTSPYYHPEISLGKLDFSHAEYVDVSLLSPLKGPDVKKTEKNWLPFVYEDKLLLLYSYDPFIIYELWDENQGLLKIFKEQTTAYDFSSFRGSAPPISFQGGYLFVVHEVFIDHQHYRNYIHRLVYLDQELNIAKISKPFVFEHFGIEYCCSICFDENCNKIVFSIGIEDSQAKICSINVDKLNDMLEPLPDLYPK